MSENVVDLITVEVRIQPGGEAMDVELPPFSTGKEIIDMFLEGEFIPEKDDQGNPYAYELVTKKNVRVEEWSTLHECGVENGGLLYIAPKLVAG